MEKSQRLLIVDIIRGFALLGLFTVHMVEYFELYWYKPEPGWVHDSVFFIFAGKAYALFALMFGFSFYIMVDRKPKAPIYRQQFSWRMTLLLIMGYIHSLLYAGDILQLLAIGGFYLLLVHKLPTKILAALAVILLLQIPTFIQFTFLLPDEQYTQPKFWALMGQNFQIFAHAPFTDLITYNTWQGQYPKWVLTLETGGASSLLGLFTAGLILGRIKLFENLPSVKTTIYGAFTFALLCVILELAKRHAPQNDDFMINWLIEGTLAKYFGLSAIAFYICVFMLIFQLFGRLTKPLAAVGRMSLTFYLGQSLIFVPLFYGFGAGWFATLGQEKALLFAVIASAIQIAIANYWLSQYRYGPFEALWRVATRLPFKGHAIN